MGLLDSFWKEEPEDLSFPNFDAFSFGGDQQSSSAGDESMSNSTHSAQSNADQPAENRQRDESESSSSNASNSSTTSVPVPPQTPTKNVSLKHRSRRKSRLASIAAEEANPRRRERGLSFDLFGDDPELQRAEPKVGWCDVCKKQCDGH